MSYRVISLNNNWHLLSVISSVALFSLCITFKFHFQVHLPFTDIYNTHVNKIKGRFMWNYLFKFIFTTLIIFTMISRAFAMDRGIYLTQYIAENPAKLNYFIREAQITGINTFVIDHEYYSSKYARVVAKAKAAGIKVVARVVVFSDGGNTKQIHSVAHWEKKFRLVEDAIKAGVNAIQLDYIRYSSKVAANPQHAKDVYQIIKWFKTRISERKIPMEIDIFGEVSYYPSMHIGQDLKMFADSVDGVNPMVYPSHFWPYQKYSAVPYKTINDSLHALVGQFNGNTPFKVHAFIEAANFHYISRTSNAEKQRYLLQEIEAVEDAKGVSGWYVWSANNVYDNLFKVLKNHKTRTHDQHSVDSVSGDKQNDVSENISFLPDYLTS